MLEVALAGAVGLLAIVIVLVNPRLFLSFTVVYIIFFPKIGVITVPGTWVAIRGEDFLIGLLLIRLIIDLATRQFPSFEPTVRRVVAWFLLLLPIGLVGLLVGAETGSIESHGVGFLYLLRKFEYFALFVAGYCYTRGGKSEDVGLLRLLKAAVIFHSALSVLQVVGVLGGFRRGTDYGPLPDDRAISTFSGAYELGGFMVMIAPAFLWLLFRRPGKVGSFIYLLLSCVTVVLTQSRSSIVALLIVLTLMAIVLAKGHRLLMVTASILVAAIVTLLSPGAFTQGRFGTLDPTLMMTEVLQAWARRSYEHQLAYGTTISELSSDLSFSYRAGRWFNYIDGVLRFNPLFGLGPSAGGEAVDGNYIRLYIEFGLLGLIVWIAVIIAVWKAVAPTPQSAIRSILVWGGLSLLIQAAFIDIFEASKVAEAYWYIAGLWLAYCHTQGSGTQPQRHSADRPRKPATA